ncbi:MAG: gamma-glutamyl-gamma-aminobutyrate hydrolase family protein [Clostridia bacterium]|nr:gamma-glutamyl-gamma-aminobutyrate hydrolase family protein [Clostridia bacterium]
MLNKILVFHKRPPETYTDALSYLGLPFVADTDPLAENDCDGLLLIGGGDVDPKLYGSDIHAEDVDPLRDASELLAIERFVRKGKRILGVCRGFQILNVFFGGTLKNVEGHRVFGKDVIHGVKAIPPFSYPENTVNSYHRQAVDLLAPNALPLLVSDDGIIEGAAFLKTVFGVQFHPERSGDRAVKRIYGDLFCAET